MKKRITAICSLLLCIATLISCVSCTSNINGEYSESVTDGYSDFFSDVLENDTEKPTEKSTQKQTSKRTTAKKTETNPIAGVSKTTNNLTSKTYNFANMSKSAQSYFKFIGRVKPCSDGLIFDDSCATLEFQGYMTGDVVIEINSRAHSYGYGNSFFTVYVDGKRVDTRFEVGNKQTKKLTIASFTGKYFHTIKIVKQTEFKWSLATIKSLQLTGYLTKAPEEKAYYVQFLGDSLTAAYGNIGKPGDEPSESPNFQDGTKSYAYLFAESINADYAMMSRSSVGVSQCWSNSPIIDYYKKFSKERSSEAFDIANARKPDLIVIHLGANDYNVGGTNKSNFVSKGKELINYLQDNYGKDVPIIWAYDPGEGFPDKVKEIMNSYGGESAGYYTLSLGWSERGAGGHPSANEHAKHAKLLLNLVTEKNILK